MKSIRPDKLIKVSQNSPDSISLINLNLLNDNILSILKMISDENKAKKNLHFFYLL